VTVSVRLSNGRSVSGQAGVNSTQAAENLGAGQLHAGQEWGPVNVTLPLTQTNTGVGPGQEALGNATMRVDADVWFNQPINFYRRRTVVCAGVFESVSGVAKTVIVQNSSKSEYLRSRFAEQRLLI